MLLLYCGLTYEELLRLLLYTGLLYGRGLWYVERVRVDWDCPEVRCCEDCTCREDWVDCTGRRVGVDGLEGREGVEGLTTAEPETRWDAEEEDSRTAVPEARRAEPEEVPTCEVTFTVLAERRPETASIMAEGCEDRTVRFAEACVRPGAAEAEEAEDEARPEAAWDTSTLRVTRFPEDALFPCAWTATPEELTACS